MKIFTEKTHNLLRKAQLLIAAATMAWGGLCLGLDLGAVGAAVTTILGSAASFVTYLVENDSANYFSTKTIVTKILPDQPPVEE